MARISSRVASVSESATLAIDAKGKALKAAGEPVISFGAGEPDFPTPEHIVQAAVTAAQDPRNHKYSPTSGLPELREAIAVKTKRDSGVAIEASNVLITNGGKQAVDHAFSTILDDGDELILPAPYWTTYPELVKLAGGKTVVISTDESSGFKVTVDQLELARTPRTKALMLVSPSNPTGAVYSEDELMAIGEWCLEHNIWVIADEIYEHLVFGDTKQHSILSLIPELADTTLVINGVAKTYSMTGWRVGWLIGPKDIIKAAGNRHSHNASNVCNIAQRAALAAVQGDLACVATMRESFDRRRKLMVELVNNIPGMSCLEPFGAFYVFANVQKLIGRQIGPWVVDNSLALVEILLEEAKVAMVPGEAFGAPGYVRLSYAVSDDTITEGLERVGSFLAEHRDLKMLPSWEQ